MKPRHSDEGGTMNDASGDQKDVYLIGKKNPTLPFYPAARAGDFIFVSGQVAKDPDGMVRCVR